MAWTSPAPAGPSEPAVSDVEYSGAATSVAVEWLSWDASAPQARSGTLERVTAAGVQDGWSGQGRQWADSANVLDLRRGEDTRAVATVRARVLPASQSAGETVTTGPAEESAAVPPQAAAGPGVPSDAGPARWLTVDVPLDQRGGQVVATAPPALVGEASGEVASPALGETATGDQRFADATEDTVERLLRAYATGDLGYARAVDAAVSGLDGAVELSELESWRAHPAGEDPTTRRGDATVTWQLPGGAELSSTYRITLEQQQGRWYLADVSVPVETTEESPS